MGDSPWKLDESLLREVCLVHPEDDDVTERAFRAVIVALEEACGPGERSADVLQGVAEALCLLYILLLDPAKCASAEKAKWAFMSALDLAYDIVAIAKANHDGAKEGAT